MNRLIKYGSVEAIPFYNCSWKSNEEWWTTGVKRPWFGTPIVILGVIIEILYIPVLYIIFKTNLIRYTCYKIMTMLAVMDIFQGAVFCSYPTFIYIAGGFVLSTWCCSCAITVSLFLNRVWSIALKKYPEHYEKRIAYVSMILCICYMVYLNMFTPGILFNSNIMIWLPDPLSEPEPSEEATAWYSNTIHDLNNWLYVVLMFILFTIYYILIKKAAQGQKSKSSKAIFFQCTIICFFNTAVAVIYNAVTLITLAPWILVFCQLCWSINHGVPVIIYVTMNDTVRRELKRLICGGKAIRVREKSVSVVSIQSIGIARF